MTREQYNMALRRHGYDIDGNLVYLKIKTGIWVQEVVEEPEDGYALQSVYLPRTDDDIILTVPGVKAARGYICELEAKKKEILDARKDEALETNIPTIRDIVSDISLTGYDEDGVYSNNWGVTDNYDGDFALVLLKDIDFMEVAA